MGILLELSAKSIKMRPYFSAILDEEGTFNMIQGFFDGRSIELDLIMRGSEHGFTKEAFNARVVGSSPTLILIKSALNKVFGGFTSVPWSTPKATTQYPDKTAFLFSMSHGTKHIISQGCNAAVEHSASNDNSIFSFGLVDLVIKNNCNLKKIDSLGNFAFLGDSYSSPDGIEEEKLPKYLAGSAYFTVSEIEVFKVKFLN